MRLKKYSSLAIIFVIGLAVAGCMERTATLWNQSNEAEGEGFGDATNRVFAQQNDFAEAGATFGIAFLQQLGRFTGCRVSQLIKYLFGSPYFYFATAQESLENFVE